MIPRELFLKSYGQGESLCSPFNTTTNGRGSGLKVGIVTDEDGAVKPWSNARIYNRGKGYMVGDTVEVLAEGKYFMKFIVAEIERTRTQKMNSERCVHKKPKKGQLT